jgi:HSP20 family protein
MLKLNKWLDFNHKRSIPIQRSQEQWASPFYNFQQEVANLLQNFYRELPSTLSNPELSNLELNPCVDLVEDENNFKIEIEMPGVDEKDIKVSINDNILNIKACKEVSKKDEGKNYIMREIAYGAYERNIQLPENADIDKAESTWKKGMLWVNLPKKSIDKSKVRELEVKKSI